MEFVPQYDDSVREYFTGRPQDTYPINPLYCLMPSSARVMATLWDPAPTIFLNTPQDMANGSPFGFNHLVPWFLFPDGTRRNAGQLATYWGMPGVPLSGALAEANIDIATPVGV